MLKKLLKKLAQLKKDAQVLDCKDVEFDTKFSKIENEIAETKAKINEERKKRLAAVDIEGIKSEGIIIEELLPAGQKKEQKGREEILESKEYYNDFYHLLQRKMTQKEFTDKYSAKVFTATDGAAVIPTTTAKEIIKQLVDYSGVFEICGKSYVKGNFTIPRKTSSSSGMLADDGTQVSEGSMTFDVVEFGAKLIQKWIEVSITLGIQSITALETLVIEDITDAIAETFAIQLAIGPGTGINATGILIDIALTNEIEITDHELAYDDLVTLPSSIKKKYRKKAAYVMSSNTYYKHVCTIKTSEGIPLVKANHAIEGGFELNIFGTSVKLDDEYPDFDTVAAEDGRFLTFGDHKRGYHVNIPLDITVKNTGENQKTGGTIFRGDMIFDGKIKDPDALVALVQNNGTV